MHVQYNNELRSCNNCCRGKPKIIAYSECVSVALVVQHGKCIRHTVICGLSGFIILFHIISEGKIVF